MKKTVCSFIVFSFLTTTAFADITINLPKGEKIDSLSYHYASIENMATAKTRDERKVENGISLVKDGKAVIPIGNEPSGYRYGISLTQEDYIDLYAREGENIEVDVISLNPFNYTMAGTDLIDGMYQLQLISDPYSKKLKEIHSQGDSDEIKAAAINLYDQYVGEIKNYINDNSESPAAVYAVMTIGGDSFYELVDLLPASAQSTILYPLLNAQIEARKKADEKVKKQEEMASGTYPAPNFTLEDLEGSMVSLSEFRGKWVILDFWGSWCIWCIKGIPELKEAYEKYKGELEIIGIDCNETREAWKKGVEKYELPWVNVYCPEGNPLITEYGIQGFPTKAIVDPEGNIKNITTGHDPAFYEKLAELMGR